ncbi:lysyl aminopeptidase [Liquorilactobacillus sucicola DSM 21376 = JCM 15457]|uniref:Aminopeptidase n=1 Tax=Liquorilactobacillus sucicola DSM 21376 = JCM 15457 TaxID=1423806 RepID=A0A023CZ75_9LACO|nr:M1 family metallopeptidase [Liquorilactobacillus sucicola]KRN07482.1 membrane alanine aminopeptidase [Liquorilactobacillus sucicola DSM 21376 = JCM 15457]GAJ26891.1 lysyl aminopeptidase [Liquorilactobacillus sucicola DSM 21376 = JCM 15457]
MAELKRFYNMFQPTHYDIFLDIDRESKKITGKTTITGTAKEQNISIHQKDLEILSVQLDGQSLPFEIDNENDALKIDLEKTGDVKLSIVYDAQLTDTMMGIYPSYYTVDGVKKQIIGTQFETNFARQAFPCIDEPEAKATFDIALKFDEHPGEITLSNMPEIRVVDGIHYFDTTVRMSTYLVAFAFGELQSKQTTTKSGVKIGVFATKAHRPSELDFGLDIAKRSIEFYEDFYQTPYPLPHSWQLALPDFSAGAMENWGLVTYREAYLLLDPENTALDMKQLVATVIAHELAHQWFGDLVTMKWWDDLWLNESFANMMEYVAVDALEPSWRIWETFQTSEVPAALQRDATDGVQSVHVNVENPAEIDALFDGAIVYAKGSRMLVMVRALIGDDALRAGLKNYFAAHQFSNATGADLWSALGDAAGIDVGAIMNSWLEQPGYPVVTASVVNGQLVLQQQQFFIGKGEEVGRQWQIPLNSNYAKAPTILAEKKVELGNYAALRESAGTPFRLNVGNNSHFIVRYDDTLLTDLLNDADSLDDISRLQLLQDLRLLAEGKQVSYVAVIPLLLKFADSHSAVVNTVLYQVAGNLKKFVTPDSEQEKNLQDFFNKLSAPQVARLGWQRKANESNDDQLTRPYVLNAALYAKNAAAIAVAHDLFTANSTNLASLPADIRVLVLRNEVKNFGNSRLFDDLLEAYRTTSDASYKADINSALTSTNDLELIARLITKFKDAETIKPQDLRAWFRGVLSNEDGQQAAWDWLRDDWDWLEKTVGGDMEFTTFITVIAGVFRTAERLAEFKKFFEPKLETPGLKREITMDIKVIESRVELIEREKEAVNKMIASIVE